jgi:acyl-CoA synthetase (AMP-forming)/AMP-acid ligase II
MPGTIPSVERGAVKSSELTQQLQLSDILRTRREKVAGLSQVEVSFEDLDAFAAERLVAYKRPRTIEFVDTPLRDDAGKVRRSILRAERLATEDTGVPPGRAGGLGDPP